MAGTASMIVRKNDYTCTGCGIVIIDTRVREHVNMGGLLYRNIPSLHQ